jgi:carboxyl-terminal processing protease
MRKKILLYSVLVIIGLSVGILIQPLISGDNLYEQIRKYQEVINNAMKNYVDPVDTHKLTEAAIKGMLNELDPHSVYITAEEMEEVNEDFQGSFDGIGVQFDVIEDTIVVISPISDGPSEKVGIVSGDKIVKIDGEDAVGLSRDLVPKKLRGPKGTKVVLDIKRSGEKELLTFNIIRDIIPLYTIDGSFLLEGTDIGIISVNRFAATTHEELTEAIKNLKTKGMKKLILDLRGNPGGFLNQAFMMADEFLSGADTIVYTKGRRPEFDEVYMSSNGGLSEDIPLVVLINDGSASASEIVSGAIQDLDRGLIVGETSFGKGLVQRQYPLSDGSAYRLTIARYYTPSGRSIQRPYKDKQDYRNLVGRIELKEGSNIEYALDMVKKEIQAENEKKIKENKKKDVINLDSIPIYYTRNGRTVLGGGGIIPDYTVKQDTITRFSVLLRMNRVFYEYIDRYLDNGKKIPEKYKKDISLFIKEWQITDAMMADFRKLAESKEIKWDVEAYKKDEEFIKTEIKGTIARSMWDRNAYMQVFFTIDKQVNVAKTLFGEAEKITKRKK